MWLEVLLDNVVFIDSINIARQRGRRQADNHRLQTSSGFWINNNITKTESKFLIVSMFLNVDDDDLTWLMADWWRGWSDSSSCIWKDTMLACVLLIQSLGAVLTWQEHTLDKCAFHRDNDSSPLSSNQSTRFPQCRWYEEVGEVKVSDQQEPGINTSMVESSRAWYQRQQGSGIQSPDSTSAGRVINNQWGWGHEKFPGKKLF